MYIRMKDHIVYSLFFLTSCPRQLARQNAVSIDQILTKRSSDPVITYRPQWSSIAEKTGKACSKLSIAVHNMSNAGFIRIAIVLKETKLVTTIRALLLIYLFIYFFWTKWSFTWLLTFAMSVYLFTWTQMLHDLQRNGLSLLLFLMQLLHDKTVILFKQLDWAKCPLFMPSKNINVPQ